jgi:hypothetical protein
MTRIISTRTLRLCIALAAAAWLVLYAFDRPFMPPALCIALQIPALPAWWLGRFSRRRETVEARAARRFEVGLSLVVTLAAAWLAMSRGVAPATSVTTLFFAGMVALDWFRGVAMRLEHSADKPLQLAGRAAGCWLVLFTVGVILLALPAATHPAVPDYGHNPGRHLAACAFMSASATCLNGATIYATGEELRGFGQAVIWLLMAGGCVLWSALGLIALRPWLSINVRLRHVLAATAALAAVGTGLMAPPWRGGRETLDGAFHASSAIAQSAFSMHQSGIGARLTDDPVFWTMLALSVAGGMGMVVLIDRISITWRRWAGNSETGVPRTATTLDLTSIELHAGVFIVSLAAGALWLCETPGVLPDAVFLARPLDLGPNQTPLRDMSPFLRWRGALMLSAEARSAGQHVSPLQPGAISIPTYVLLLGVMGVGGAVGSCAGGIRTGTIAIVATTGSWRRAGRAMIPGLAWRIIFLTAALHLIAIAALYLTQPDVHLWTCVLDGVSLVSGVGYTAGLTPLLDGTGRWLGALLMLAGRLVPTIGWCAIAAALTRTPDVAAPNAPEGPEGP